MVNILFNNMEALKYMNRKKVKIGLGATIVFVMILFSSFQGLAVPEQTQKEMVEVSIYNFEQNTIRHQAIEFEKFISLFQPLDADKETSFYSSSQAKINQLYEIGLLTESEFRYLENQLQIVSMKGLVSGVESKGVIFDLLNIFNGFGFAIKGEKIRSFINLPILQFPFLNTNLTALFTGFNSFEGNGFIFTLGANGFRYIYTYDRDEYDFPYFSPIKGWFIGYTGILMEATVSDIVGEEYEGTYIIGFGMNVMTLWSNR
jgi:hypothetical protein